MESFITGIQQCGIGVCNAEEAAVYYKDLLGFTALVFDDVAEATLMKSYTGGKVEKRRALLTMNMQGGGGLELWQFLNRQPTHPVTQILPGDPGIYAIKIKSTDINKAVVFFGKRKDIQASDIIKNAAGEKSFWLTDRYKNVFQIVEKKENFTNTGHVVAGVCGVVIGVRNMKNAISFYRKILGESEMVFENEVTSLPGYHIEIDSCLLRKEASRTGAFANLLGGIDLELHCTAATKRKHIYTDRFWGDPGYIHFCVDVLNTDKYTTELQNAGYIMTVDSRDCFDMGKAGGRFGYVEDPDGTLIELVETYKVPVLKKWGLFLHLKNQEIKKPLPKWIVKLLGLNKVNFANKEN